MRSISKPPGLFSGKNFMTPDVLGYYRLRKGYAELSEGTGLSRQPIYGVTVQVRDGVPESAASQLFQSKQAALDHIRALS